MTRKVIEGIIKFVCSGTTHEVEMLKLDKEDMISKGMLSLVSDDVLLEDVLDSYFGYTVFALMDGMQFFADVKAGCLTDYDGYVANVFIDDFITNARLDTGSAENFSGFMLDDIAWKDLCKNHKVEVDWVNK